MYFQSCKFDGVFCNANLESLARLNVIKTIAEVASQYMYNLMYSLQNVHDCNSLTSGKSVVKILSSVIFCETEFFWHTVCRNVTEKCSYKIIMSSNLDFITTTALCNTSHRRLDVNFEKRLSSQ